LLTLTDGLDLVVLDSSRLGSTVKPMFTQFDRQSNSSTNCRLLDRLFVQQCHIRTQAV